MEKGSYGRDAVIEVKSHVNELSRVVQGFASIDAGVVSGCRGLYLD